MERVIAMVWVELFSHLQNVYYWLCSWLFMVQLQVLAVESLTLTSDKIPKTHYSFAALGATVFSDACHLVLLLTAQYLHNTGKYSILMPKLFAAVVICRFHWLYAWPAWLPRLVAELVLIYFLLLHSFICVC